MITAVVVVVMTMTIVVTSDFDDGGCFTGSDCGNHVGVTVLRTRVRIIQKTTVLVKISACCLICKSSHIVRDQR